MKRYKMTNTAKILLFVLLIVIIAGGVFLASKKGLIDFDKADKVKNKQETQLKDKADKEESKEDVKQEEASNEVVSSGNEINISLDEWIG